MDIYLDGTWNLVVDPDNLGIQNKWYSINWAKSPSKPVYQIHVPSSFNTLPGLERYIGTVWYIKKLPDIPYRPQSHEYSLEFEGSNYYTQVWLNGNYLGENHGGFLPFRVLFNPRLIAITGENYLVVRVSNLLDKKSIPCEVFDWFNWGGIHRSAKLLILEKTRITNIRVTTKIRPPKNSAATISISLSIKNTQEFLDRCYAMQIEPQLEWELYYLGRFFDGEQQFNQILLQTGILDINPEIPPPLEHVSHDLDSLQYYFEEVLEEIEQVEENIDLETYFNSISRKPSKREIRREDKERKEKIYKKDRKGKKNRKDKDNRKDKNNRKDINNKIEKKTGIKRKVRKENQIPGKFNSNSAEAPDYNGNFDINITNPSLWSPDSPELYLVKLHLNGIDEDKEVRFGIREISVKRDQILLNRRPIRLIGATLKDEKTTSGTNPTKEQMRKDILRLKSLGMNLLYPSYYPYSRELLELADEEGILIIEALPLIKKVHLNYLHTRRLAVKMVYSLLKRDYNHPSIIIWLLADEINTFDYSSRRFFSHLIHLAKTVDPTRLVSISSNYLFFNGIRKEIDVVCQNFRFNYVYGGLKQFSWILDTLYAFQRNKPVIVTQFASKFPKKIKKMDKDIAEFDYYAKNFLLNQIKVVKSKPYVQGIVLGILKDYRAPLHSVFQKGEVLKTGFFTERDHPRDIVPIIPNLFPHSGTPPNWYFPNNLPTNFHFNVIILRYFLFPFEIFTLLQEKFQLLFLRLKARLFFRQHPTLKQQNFLETTE